MANGNLFNPYRFLTDTSTTASSGFNFTNPVNLPVNINDPNRFGQMDAKLDLTKGGAKSGSASSVTLGGDGGDVEDKGLTSGQAGGIGMIAEGLGNVLTGVIGGSGTYVSIEWASRGNTDVYGGYIKLTRV